MHYLNVVLKMYTLSCYLLEIDGAQLIHIFREAKLTVYICEYSSIYTTGLQAAAWFKSTVSRSADVCNRF